ncbi:hypothetical protein Egran_02183 [Elaphomyces granulatus]|uniref:DOC domain-containing protein n=1 Tax=Elaphomyces granulatus TaxID=519963 RepID=A0A232M159_9EURO|nr:hypothetical protein Egran_02183 [Elaphomyces granulatus]
MPRHLLRRAPAHSSTPPVATDHAPQPMASQVQAPPASPRPAIMEMPPGFPVSAADLYRRRPVARTASASASSSSATTARWPQGAGIAMDNNSLDTMEMEDQEGGEEGGDEELLGQEHEHDHGREHQHGEVDVEHGGLDEGDEEAEQDEDEEMQDRNKSPSPLPPNLREISSLASWTVSTHKPGCGVAALRHPSPTQFWQSDGPQPHTLTLHFFKLVAVVKIRVYLDFELDESYTPTKMVFLAGMGGNDLVGFASWEGEGPCGWVDIPLDGVGGRSGGMGNRGARRRRRKAATRRQRIDSRQKNAKFPGVGSLADDSLSDFSGNEGDGVDHYDDGVDDDDDPLTGNVLKAMVIQVRICENHQNGKDTHVRGFQVFSHDDEHHHRQRVATGNGNSGTSARRLSAGARFPRGRVKVEDATASAAVTQDDHQDENLAGEDEEDSSVSGNRGTMGLIEPDWMGEPVIR